MPIRAIVAALLLPLPFAALPVLSLWLGGSGPRPESDYAFSTNSGITREFVLIDGPLLSDLSTVGDSSVPTAYTPDGRVMAGSDGCGRGGSIES